MKKAYIILTFGIICQGSFGQIRENMIKIHPYNFFLGSISMGYERALDAKNSIDIGIGIPITNSVNTEIAKVIIHEDYKVNKAEMSNFHFRAAYRHYTGGQRAPKGFYYEPYMKYQAISPYFEGESIDDKGALEGRISSFTTGFQLGYQFLISGRVTLDFYFFGLEAGVGRIKLKGTSSTDIEGYKEDIEQGVDGIPYYGRRIKVEVVGDELEVSAKNIFVPLYRAGLSLGIAF